jgi:hypothetical protein
MQIMKTFLKTCYYSVAAGALALPATALAQVSVFDTAKSNVAKVGDSAGVDNAADASLPDVIGNIINIALGFIGILLLVYILWAGFLWMTAGGDEGKVKTATAMIKNAIIGLLIIVAAFAISNFVLESLIDVTT